jgi:hypothetical protein
VAVTRVLRAQLYEVSPTDPVTLLAALTVLTAAAATAIWLPARRAARIAPMEALRMVIRCSPAAVRSRQLGFCRGGRPTPALAPPPRSIGGG